MVYPIIQDENKALDKTLIPSCSKNLLIRTFCNRRSLVLNKNCLEFSIMKFQLWGIFLAVEIEVTILVQCSHEHNLVIVNVTNLYIGSHKCDGNEWTKNVDKMSLRLSSRFSHEHLHICKFKMFVGKLGRKPYIHFVNISL